MKKRGMFIGTGTVLLVLGLTGLALVQTGVISSQFPGVGKTLELEPPQRLAEAPAQPPAVEGKLPPVPEDRLPPPEPSPKIMQESKPQEQKAVKPVPVPKVEQGIRVYPRQDQPEPPAAKGRKQAVAKKPTRSTDSRHHARKGTGTVGKPSSRPAAEKKPVVVKFRFNPTRSRELSVARVHFGDKVIVKVRRVGQPGREVYVSFGIPSTFETPVYSEWGAGARGAVLTPLRDNDKLVLTAEQEFGPLLTIRLDSREGAVLRLGARGSRFGYDRGYYEIEMRIYSENRWNLRPRSLL